MPIFSDKGIGVVFLLAGAYFVWISLRSTSLSYDQTVREYHVALPPKVLPFQLESSKKHCCSFRQPLWNQRATNY